MNDDILSSKFVIENGMDYEDFDTDICSNALLIPDTNIGFTGLVYEDWHNDGERGILYYCYYVDGFEEGAYIEFWDDEISKIREISHFRLGRLDGEHKKWDDNGNLVEERIYKLGTILKYRKYGKNGNIIKEKKEPNEEDLKNIKRQEKNFKTWIYSFSHSYHRIETIEWNKKQITNKEVKKLLEEYIQNIKDLKIKKNLILTNPFEFRFLTAFEKSIPKNAVDKNPTIERIKNPLFKKICICYLELCYLAGKGYDVEEVSTGKADKDAREYYKIYDPLIEIFEKGGSFEVVDGHVKVGNEFDIDFSDF